MIGCDFFPSVDAGLIKLHVRACMPGTRIEETERRIGAISETIRSVIPLGEIQTMIDNIGVPTSGINLFLSEGALISSADAQILVVSRRTTSRHTADCGKPFAEAVRLHPETTFFFLAPDISWTPFFSRPAGKPIDACVVGPIGA